MDVNEEQYHSVCRTCLSEKDNMRDIFNIADVLMICAPIQIEEGDGLPTTICSECVTQINQSYDFRLLCEQSDNVLRKKLIKRHLILIKTESYENESPETFTQHSTSPDLVMDQNEDPLDYLYITNIYEETQEIVNITELETAENSSKNEEIATNKRKRCRKSKKKDINKENAVHENKTELEEQTKQKTETESAENSSGKEETSKELSCKYCNMKFKHKNRLANHEQRHQAGLKCQVCGKEFTIIRKYMNHINIHNRKNGSHLCPTCGKTFTLKENLIHHLKIHSGVKPYKCDQCDKAFIRSTDLKTHLVTHSSEKAHLCNICGNKYARQISLRSHIKKKHTITSNHKSHICAVCGKSFLDRSSFNRHIIIHTGERSHICGVCGKAFYRGTNLRVHERIHKGHKPHVCPVCQRAFSQKHVLVTHMRTHPQTGKNPGIDHEPEQTSELE